MTRTQFGYSRNEQATCERLIIRYRLPDGAWQADHVWLALWPESELAARRRLRRLLDEGRDAELIRRTPVL